MAVVGDRIELLPSKAGQVPRAGVVTAITGVLITVRWDTGEETKFVPGPGVLSVVGGGRGTPARPARPRATRSAASAPAGRTPKAGAATKKAAPTKKASTHAISKKAASATKKPAKTPSGSKQSKAKAKGKRRKK